MKFPCIVPVGDEPVMVVRGLDTVTVHSPDFPSVKMTIIVPGMEGLVYCRETGESSDCLRECIGWAIVSVATKAEQKRLVRTKRQRRMRARKSEPRGAKRISDALEYVFDGVDHPFHGAPQLPSELPVFRNFIEKIAINPDLLAFVRELAMREPASDL